MATVAIIPFAGSLLCVAVTIPVSSWCPITHEPQTGSTITFRYTPESCVLDILDLSWLVPTAQWPRDLEAAAVYLQGQARAALGVSVSIAARFVLASGVVIECQN